MCVYIDGFSDIDECNGNHSCQVNATLMDTMFVYYTGMDFKCFRLVL